jgi:hypothetical protein
MKVFSVVQVSKVGLPKTGLNSTARMVKILERPEDQKPAMMDSSHERQSVGSSTYSAI